MKKVFKGIAVLAATAAMGTGLAFSAGCGGSDGKYIGHYCYDNYGQVYGMVVEVTVENNIITKVEDVTATYADDAGKGKITYTFKNDGKDVTVDNTAWHTCSAPWEEYFAANIGATINIVDPEAKAAYEANNKVLPSPDQCMYVWGAAISYDWFKTNTDDWANLENWLLQQYIGWSVADVRDISVFYNSLGEPYKVEYKGNTYNGELASSGLLISGATQGSGRLLLAVQNALGK